VENAGWDDREEGYTPRCETLVYRLLTPRSTHNRAQLASLPPPPACPAFVPSAPDAFFKRALLPLRYMEERLPFSVSASRSVGT